MLTGCERENDILLRVVVIVLGVWRPCDPLANPQHRKRRMLRNHRMGIHLHLLAKGVDLDPSIGTTSATDCCLYPMTPAHY